MHVGILQVQYNRPKLSGCSVWEDFTVMRLLRMPEIINIFYHVRIMHFVRNLQCTGHITLCTYTRGITIVCCVVYITVILCNLQERCNRVPPVSIHT